MARIPEIDRMTGGRDIDALIKTALQRDPGRSHDKISLKSLRALGARSPRTDMGAVAGPGGGDDGGGFSLKGLLKGLGQGALNAISVPQAVGFYGLSNLIGAGQVLAGKDNVKTMELSDMLGNFSEGYKGSEEIYDQVGLPNNWARKWASLITDVALDPAWAVGFAKLPATAAKVANAASDLSAATRLAAGVSKDAGTTAMLGKFKDAGNIGRAGRAAEKAEDAAEAVIKRNQVIKVEQGAHPRMPQAPAQTRGAVIDDTWTVVKTATGTKKKGDKPYYAIYENLDGDARVINAAQEPLGTVFRSQREAIEWVAKRRAEVGEGVTLEERLINAVGPAGSSLVTPAARDRSISKLAEFEKGRWSGKGKMGVRIGFGKGNPEGGKGLSKFAGIGNYTFRTPVPLPGRTLGAMNSGSSWASFIRRDPVDKVAHRLGTAGREQIEHIGNSFRDDARKLFPNLTDEQLNTLFLAADAANTSLTGSKRANALYGASGIEGEVDMGQAVIGMLKESGQWTDEMQRAFNWGRGWLDDHAKLEHVLPDEVRGDYIAHPMSRESAEYMKENTPHTSMFSGRGPASEVADKSRQMESMANWFYSHEEFSDYLQKKMGLPEDVADDIAWFYKEQTNRLAETPYYKGRSGEVRFREDAGQDALPEWLNPDTDFLSVIGRRDAEHVRRMYDRQIEKMFIDEGFAEYVPKLKSDGTPHPYKEVLEFADEKYAKAWERIRRRVNPQNLQGMLSEHDKTNAYMNFMAHFKGLLTTFNIQHPVSNMMGDSWNRMVAGNFLPAVDTLMFRAGGPGKGVTKGSQWAKLATRNDDAMKAIHVIGGQEYTGAEIYALSHMMGLGKGYVGEDIAKFIRMNEASKWPSVKYYRYMQRYNMTREDAVRLQTFFKHMEKGASPWEAQYKTLLGVFDYGDLTDFEKIYLRNILLFYTWMRKNTALQVKMFGLRPGLPATAADFDRDREKMASEPDYLREMGLVPVPGFGALNVFGPWADIHKLDPTPEGLRKNVLGSLAPPLKQAIELGTNTNLFTGGDLEKYEGQLQPSGLKALDAALNYLGIGQPSRTREDGALQPAIPAQLAYWIKQLGVVPAQAAKLSGEDSPYADASIIDQLAVITGFPRRVLENPDWPRQQKLQQAREKAAETRRKNATTP